MAPEKLQYQNQINWGNLATAQIYYRGLGYQYLEVPWLVPQEITQITYNKPTRFRTSIGDLVGSGEQSFLYLQKEDNLLPDKYFTITPCFRDEPETQWNFKQFMKLELYVTNKINKQSLQNVIEDCRNFFKGLLKKDIELVKMGDQSYDLMCEGIELGSYGIMHHDDISWICATGIAEPRTSQVGIYERIRQKNNRR